MKKLAIAIIIALAASTAYAADIDLSGMTFAELNELQQQITIAMWATEEWQEVTVPSGVYLVGDDIPAGEWAIGCVPDAMSVHITLTTGLDDTKTGTDYDHYITGETVYSATYKDGKYAAGEETNWQVNLADGVYVIVDGEAVFMPPTKTKLGFK